MQPGMRPRHERHAGALEKSFTSCPNWVHKLTSREIRMKSAHLKNGHEIRQSNVMEFISRSIRRLYLIGVSISV
jgi:hypothetical protein